MKYNKLLIFFSVIVFFQNNLIAQVNFEIGNEHTSPSGQACVSITTEDFQNVIGFQFSIHWESNELQFDSLTNFGLSFLDGNDFNLTNTNNGVVSVIWDDANLEGQDLLNGSTLFEICFTANGNSGDTLNVVFSELPTPPVVTQFDGTNLDESTPNQTNGFITISNALFLDGQNVIDVNCFGGMDGSISVQIGGGIIPYSYFWDSSLPDTNVVSNLNNGLYNLTVTDDLGDSLILSFTISQPNHIAIDSLQLPDLTCVDTQGIVHVLASGGNSPYVFEMASQFSADGIFEDIEAGLYTLQITDANGCEIIETINIESPVLPLATLLGDTLSCGTPIELTVDGIFENYEWFLNGMSLNSNQSVFEATSSGLYEVQVTNDDLCISTTGISIFFPPQIDVSIDAIAFETCPNDTIILTLQGAETYSWSGNSLEIIGNQNAIFSSPQTGVFIFDMIGEDEYNCFSDSTSIEILVMEPMGYADKDTCIKKGGFVQLNAFGGVEYLWMENEFSISNMNIPNPISTPDSNAIYVVEIKDDLGCITIDSIHVSVVDNPIEFIKPINVITPNGDGENDFLIFDILEKFSRNKLVVFNRWGNIVYEKLGYENDWGGTYKGKELPTGEYFYILTINDQQLKSTLTILND